MSDDVIIKVENISLAFGGVQALYNVGTQSLDGEILAIIGPNGAGKTCLLNCISRFYTPQEGLILYKDQDILGIPTHGIAKLGIARTFQNIELFKGMTVLDNIKLGRHAFLKSGIFSDVIYWGRTRREELKLRREIEEKIIDLLEIETIRKKVVGTLPYGLQKRVELARALAMQPDILLMDEPCSALDPVATLAVEELMRQLSYEYTIVIVTHNMQQAARASDLTGFFWLGRLIEFNQTDELFTSPGEELTESYITGRQG